METDLSTCNPTDIFNSFDSDTPSYTVPETSEDVLFSLSDEDFISKFDWASNESPEQTAEKTADPLVEETHPSEVASDEQLNDCQNADDLYTSDFFDSAFWSLDGVDIPELFPEIIPEPAQANTTMDEEIFISESSPSFPEAQDPADTFIVEPPQTAEDQPADPEEPPRKRTRHRRKQIVPAGISYNELAGSVATTEPTPSLPVPQQAPIHQNTAQAAVYPVPFDPVFNPEFDITELALALQNFGQKLMSYHNLGHNNSTPSPVIPLPPALPTACAGQANFIPTSTFPTQPSNASIPVSRGPPVPNHQNGTFTTTSGPQSAAPSRPRPVQQFTFAETSVPESFVANPNNHGRWQIDASGRRHYLNGPKNRRPQ
ncbi:hypothetical protein Plec18167_004748 [Paecilomyces lecythidis]|uniref:Uncharacterized protein n=1 Tax=Paecilomyces lecythidis TaxID=3004212 RepID=A0ABR3XP74_9EURO